HTLPMLLLVRGAGRRHALMALQRAGAGFRDPRAQGVNEVRRDKLNPDVGHAGASLILQAPGSEAGASPRRYFRTRYVAASRPGRSAGAQPRPQNSERPS